MSYPLRYNMLSSCPPKNLSFIKKTGQIKGKKQYFEEMKCGYPQKKELAK